MIVQPSFYAAAIACFSASGTLIVQVPREDRRTLFIFPAILCTVLGFSMFVFEANQIGFWRTAAWVAAPAVIMLAGGRAAPVWLLTLLSYMALLAGIVVADLAFHQGHFG